jgi:glucosyl-dolichyl phosphate glucuronosyltransferase
VNSKIKPTYSAIQPLTSEGRIENRGQRLINESSASPEVSVIICTHNRVKMLELTILSIIKQDFDPNRYEIIVVDNASQDGTRDFMIMYSEKTLTPSIRYVYEPRLGSSWARNAGWQAARGNYVAYIDDDESAEPSWLRLLMSGFERHSTSIAAVGGTVVLEWGGKKPNWLPNTLEKFYSGVDFGPNARILTNEEYPLTANLAIRREMYDEIGGFRTALGHVGNMPSGGEDIDLLRRIRSNRADIFYEPKAVVYHHIPKTRQRRRWILKRCYAGGMSQPILDGLNSVSVKEIFYNIRLAVFYLLKASYFLIRNQEIAFVEYGGISMMRLGRAVGLIRIFLK